ncbi:uncharacterized protein LOC134804446 [Cydia splendana]|uniref:uncharacterized protein LOC134804446 n=1 Tax=Cydia splendana TaxID=1100963 RepID=UPI0028F49E42
MVTNRKQKSNDRKTRPSGFGSSVPRFGKLTLHPNLDPSGQFKLQEEANDPCRYHPIPIHEIFVVNKNRTDAKDVWRFKAEMEDWCKNLGYRNQKILQHRRWMQSVGGPAWCQPQDLPKYEAACKNVGFGRAPRFIPKKCFTPPPGIYFKATPYKAPYGPHSTLPSFEYGEPCRFPDRTFNWSLAPNRYTIVDKDSIEQKSNKLVSLRGPYELFTGRRDTSTIISQFNGRKCPAATWPVALPGSFERFKKTRLGVMNKTGRDKSYKGRNALVDIAMAPRKPSDPGPLDTNIDNPKVFKQNKRGFNSSYDRPPGYQRTIVWPAVGRYQAQPLSCGIIGHGHKHVFLSKQQRTIGAYLPEPMNTF